MGPSVPAPQAGSVYVPGTWAYRQDRYLWRPGFWYLPRPGWLWIPAHFVWTPSGYVFVSGYWDHPLENRGLLFAPVAIDPSFLGQPGWYLRPRYAVYTDFLLNALFVRPGAYSYYFGDYFDRRYNQLGYRSWLDYRLGRSSPDPLFSYYNWHNRGTRGWLPGMRELYSARYNGTAPRPPHTLVQQNTLIQNNQTVNINVNQISAVAPVTKLDARRTVVKVLALPPAQHQQAAQLARQAQKAGQQRAQIETQILKQGSAPLKAADRPHTVKVPRQVAAIQPPKQAKTPPPIPTHPEHEARPVPKYQPPKAEIRPTPKPKPAPKADVKTPQPKPAPKPEAKSAPKPAPKPPAKEAEKKKPKPPPPEAKPAPKPPPKETEKKKPKPPPPEAKPAPKPPPKETDKKKPKSPPPRENTASIAAVVWNAVYPQARRGPSRSEIRLLVCNYVKDL
jgi:hypothetical protein